jgi:predicted MFS family arabinose efflux permease
LFFTILEIAAVLGIGKSNLEPLIILFFVFQITTQSILYFLFDLNIEQEIISENTTGRKRGVFLSVQNTAWVLSPLTLTFLITKNNFGNVYILSAAILIPLILLITIYFKNTKTPKRTAAITDIFKSIGRGSDQVRILGTQFMLNFFYSWMLIYLPLVLTEEIGFDWQKIGFLFTIMLLPFLLFEFPAGVLSDKKTGEKEFLIAGFIIMSFSTLAIPLLNTTSFLAWAAVLFTTRIGASLVEIASESFFFKHVKEENTGLISLFRMARPLSFIIAPLVALPVVYYFSYTTSFYFLAFIVLIGLFFIPKVDTR